MNEVGKIEILKSKAQRLYKEYVEARDAMDCGHKLAVYISGDVRKPWGNFVKVMEELERIDSKCPPFWAIGIVVDD